MMTKYCWIQETRSSLVKRYRYYVLSYTFYIASRKPFLMQNNECSLEILIVKHTRKCECGQKRLSKPGRARWWLLWSPVNICMWSVYRSQPFLTYCFPGSWENEGRTLCRCGSKDGWELSVILPKQISWLPSAKSCPVTSRPHSVWHNVVECRIENYSVEETCLWHICNV